MLTATAVMQAATDGNASEARAPKNQAIAAQHCGGDTRAAHARRSSSHPAATPPRLCAAAQRSFERTLTRALSPCRQLRRLLRDNEWAANAELRTVKAVWPLHAAIFFSHEPCVALLLRHGANANAKDCTDRTALQAARRLKRDAIVALLQADATARRARACRSDSAAPTPRRA